VLVRVGAHEAGVAVELDHRILELHQEEWIAGEQVAPAARDDELAIPT
jgi:hypothetical protein